MVDFTWNNKLHLISLGDEPPPIVPPYRGNYIPYYDAGADKSDVRVSDVTYAKTIHREVMYHCVCFLQ